MLKETDAMDSYLHEKEKKGKREKNVSITINKRHGRCLYRSLKLDLRPLRNSLASGFTRPFEKVATILRVDVLPSPLVSSSIVARANRSCTDIKLLPPVRSLFVHSKRAGGLVVDVASRRLHFHEQRRPGLLDAFA